MADSENKPGAPDPDRLSGSSAPYKGIACMVAGGALLTANDAILKWLTGGYPVGQIMFLRGLFTFVMVAYLVWRAGGVASLKVVRFKGHLVRAGLVVGGTFMFVTGLSLLPLADAIAISFAGPLFITALAPAMLGEHVGWRRWTAVLIGFVGVLVMIRPTGEAVQWAALLPLAASLTGAFRDILTRGMAARESSVAILFISTTAVCLGGLATAPFGWAPVTVRDIGLFALAGLVLGGAHFLLIETFRFAEAALVAPFKYANIIWAVTFGFIIWGDLPDRWTIGGAAFVICSGLYILHRESVRGKTL